MNIRETNKEDVGKIWELGKNVGGFETSPDIVTFWPTSILNQCVNKSDVIMLVGELDNEIIAFIILNVNHSLSKAEIENIFVSENYRKRGYGEALLNRALEECSKRRIENICAMSSDAVDFYEKRGFRKGNQFYWMDLALSDRFKK